MKKSTNQIKTFFTTAGPSGIDRLDAVAFVAQSSLARLTPSQKYIFESILAIFGKDIENCYYAAFNLCGWPKAPNIGQHQRSKLSIPQGI